MNEEHEYCMVLSTCPSLEEAKKIASLLVDRRLAACVQITGITSCYEWKGTVNMDSEQLLIIKARSEHYEGIESCITEHHSYEVPEIVMIPVVRGSASYLGWINESTRR